MSTDTVAGMSEAGSAPRGAGGQGFLLQVPTPFPLKAQLWHPGPIALTSGRKVLSL